MSGMTAVLMAGGKGSRIASLRSDIPKPMIDICGKPVLERQIECLKENGISEIVLVTGHLGEVIQSYFGNGSRWGVHIRYIHEHTPLGTAGALYYLRDLQEDFFLINGDIIFDADLGRMYKWHRKKGADITLFAHPNGHPYDSTLLQCDASGRVLRMGAQSKENPRNCVNAGIHILSPRALHGFDTLAPKSLDREVILPQIPSGTVYAYRSPEYVRDMGTPERYCAVCRDFEGGIVRGKNLRFPQRAIFLDRDGTINTYKGYITAPEQLELEPGAAEAVRRINQSGYLAIVVTNQPVIARGDCSLEDLEQIHGRLDALLGEGGAYLDGLLFCPHHPDRGFPGERPEYKVKCACRKPEPGLIFQAAEQFHIDLQNSYLIGDGDRDIQAGNRAGCKTLRIGPDGTYQNLYYAVKSILGADEDETRGTTQ